VLGTDLSGTGIPTEAEFVSGYCAHAGRPVPPALDVFVVFSMFRLASIIAGVWRRALDGNAADPRAIGYRDRYRDMAERAWELARRIDPAGA
jgi:aminoglycoside phosphotransferase (APT) family kinase protein